MNKQHTHHHSAPQQQQQHYKSIVVHVSSNTLKAPLVYSLDSGELGYRAGERERGGKRDQSIFPLLFKRNEGTCYYVKAEKFDADSEKKEQLPLAGKA
jgi:hypothetical protein